ncbi:MAG: ATP synthase subunit C [Oscillospiraceae bacterium]|nr:ATP synthase subunit C [Oscillospiraceae bacterium]MDD7354348.1 ATP synthase subunit C [Oscillospiraceae bacterium]MDY3936800.1 ATP synthase subunit C [Oscillospiraceae bacterium]
MSTFLYVILFLVPAAGLAFIVYKSVKNRADGMDGKTLVRKNLFSFALVLAVTAAMAFSVSAVNDSSSSDTSEPVTSSDTAETAQTTEKTDGGLAKAIGLLSAGLATGLAGIGGGIAVAAGAPAAIAATSEDPKSFGKSLIFVALGESIALYGVVISILVLNNI